MGALYLGGLPVILGLVLIGYALKGPNWFVGAFGFLLLFALIMEFFYYFGIPRAHGKRLSDPSNRTATVETSIEGAQVSMGRNSGFVKWSAFKYVWYYDDFIIFANRPPYFLFFYLPTAGMTPEARRDIENADAIVMSRSL
jgi:hypothetical protein